MGRLTQDPIAFRAEIAQEAINELVNFPGASFVSRRDALTKLANFISGQQAELTQKEQAHDQEARSAPKQPDYQPSDNED